MSYHVYKLIHLSGIMLLFLSFGGLLARGMLKGDGTAVRKLAGMTAAIALLVVFFGGFGLIAKLGTGFPGWVIAKILIWFAFGGLIGVVNRKPEKAPILWWALPALGAVAAYLALFKPF